MLLNKADLTRFACFYFPTILVPWFLHRTHFLGVMAYILVLTHISPKTFNFGFLGLFFFQTGRFIEREAAMADFPSLCSISYNLSIDFVSFLCSISYNLSIWFLPLSTWFPSFWCFSTCVSIPRSHPFSLQWNTTIFLWKLEYFVHCFKFYKYDFRGFSWLVS